MVPWGFVVEHFDAVRPPRPALSVPAAQFEYYGIPDGAIESLGDRLTSALNAVDGRGRVSLRLRCVELVSTVEFYPARTSSDRGPRPLVLMTPPTQAGFAARYLAERYARRGVHAAIVIPHETYLETHLTPREIESKFREAAIAARVVVRALAARDDADGDRLNYLGGSAGGIFGAVLLAVEPSIRRATLLLPGGNLQRIIAASVEPTVVAYREAWRTRGVDTEALSAEISSHVVTDPQRLARYVNPGRVLIFLGASDTKVPVATGWALRRALGGPETYVMAGNHDTAALCFGFVLRRIDAFFFEG